MNAAEKINSSITYFDGGLGTLLQQKGLAAGEPPEMWNLTHARELTEIHLEYLKAGADIIAADTFGVNSLKFENCEEIIRAAMKNVKEAIELFGADNKYAAFDIGSLGRMLKPLGGLEFEKATELFSEVLRLAEKYGADLILIETMNDLYETKAAVLAAKEACSLPLFVTNSFDASGRLMTGASPAAVIATLEGLGVDAVGLNCSLGPEQLMDIVKQYLKYSSLPVIVNPNAGFPAVINGKTVYDVDADKFSDIMAEMVSMGVQGVGGCCGTTPEYINKIVQKTRGLPYSPPVKKNYTLVSSFTHAVEIGASPVLIGERINPTGKPEFKKALRENDIGYILSRGIEQQEKGVHILDVNVGLPETDETKLLEQTVQELQAVLDLPLQIDTVNVQAMEKALRIYNGKPLINSVNAKEESMRQIFPLAKKYGGVLIALTIDENGIPDTAEGRLKLASRITERAREYGIDKKDIIADPLALTVSADDKSAEITLEALKLIKEKLGLKCSLGISNISFGLPLREDLNSVFFTMALAAGLDLAIINPLSFALMKSYYCFLALKGRDKGCAGYIDFASPLALKAAPEPSQLNKDAAVSLEYAVIKGMKSAAFQAAEKLIERERPLTVINNYIIPALDTVGACFENKTMFLPQLLMSAEAASSAFEAVKSAISESAAKKGKIILATVKGDIHDIGKNIVKVILQNYGYEVTDLGCNVPPERILEAAREEQAPLVGLSALMTTTLEAMRESIALLKKELPELKTIVGGAVLSEEYARRIGADKYCKDVMEAVRYADEFFAR